MRIVEHSSKGLVSELFPLSMKEIPDLLGHVSRALKYTARVETLTLPDFHMWRIQMTKGKLSRGKVRDTTELRRVLQNNASGPHQDLENQRLQNGVLGYGYENLHMAGVRFS